MVLLTLFYLAFAGLILWMVTFLYRFRTGRSFLQDTKELWLEAWPRLPYLSPIIFAALSAYGFGNRDLVLTVIMASLCLFAALALFFWSRAKQDSTGRHERGLCDKSKRGIGQVSSYRRNEESTSNKEGTNYHPEAGQR